MNVGVIGGGQLALMLAEAAKPLGIQVFALSERLECPAQHAATIVAGQPRNPEDLKRFISQIDLLTFEFENVDVQALKNAYVPIYPSLDALKIAQDRELEKNCFVQNHIPTTRFKVVNNHADCLKAVDEIGLPCVIKTCREGYDGKGQAVIRQLSDLEKVWSLFEGKRILVENCVPFDREVSIIAVRDQHGEIKYYPLTENIHRGGILRVSKAPYADATLQNLAETYAQKVLKSLNYVGVLAIEFFQQGTQLFANEMAPRVHNSGHWTIEGARTSQFENHIRAVCGLPLGDTSAVGYSAMVNFIGTIPNLDFLREHKNIYFHDYFKSVQPNRKLAHMTICAATVEELERLVAQLI
jgi:5-(carboxyamino)imidazole ribonucleotide synthase